MSEDQSPAAETQVGGEETEDSEWTSPPRRRSRWRTVGRGVWNTLAIFGLAGILAMGFGFAQGYRQFAEFNEDMKSPPVQPEATRPALDFSLPEEFVAADLAPIPPMEKYPMAGSAVSLRNPFERVLLWSRMMPETAAAAVEESTTWLEEESGLGYRCGLDASSLLPAKWASSATVTRCQRPLRAYEMRAAGTKTGDAVYVNLELDDVSYLMQITLTGSVEAVEKKLDRLLSGLTYGDTA